MPPAQKAAARRMVAAALADPPAAARAWVRVNAARTDLCAADLDAVAATPTASASPRPSRPRTSRGWPSGRRASRSSARSSRPAGCWPPPRSPPHPGCAHLAMGGVDLQQDLGHRRQQPRHPLRAQPPRRLLAGGADRAADRQRVPAPRGRRRAAGAGGVRPDAWASSASPPSTRGSCRSCTRCSPRPSGSWPGRGRWWPRSPPPTAPRSGCPTASSSTCPWRSGRSGCSRGRDQGRPACGTSTRSVSTIPSPTWPVVVAVGDDVEGAPVVVAEHAGEAAAVGGHGLQHLAALGDADAALVGDVGVPDRALGVEADAVGRGALAEVGPDPPVDEVARVGDRERGEPVGVRLGDDQRRRRPG